MDLKALHATKSIKARPTRKRVGRGVGSGLGKTSGRGQKGAGSRSGHHMRDYYEGGQTPLMRRIPKRGFSNDPFARSTFAVLNVADLNAFDDGTTVDPRVLEEQGWLKQPGSGLKILGDGELEKRLIVKAHRFSKSAIEKITAKGGEAVTLLPLRKKGPKKLKLAAQRAAGVLVKKPKGGDEEPAADAKAEKKPGAPKGEKPAGAPKGEKPAGGEKKAKPEGEAPK